MIKSNNKIIEGSITIGCVEVTAVETLAKVCKIYKEKYLKVMISIHTATADVVHEMMEMGLVDIALFLEPADIKAMPCSW